MNETQIRTIFREELQAAMSALFAVVAPPALKPMTVAQQAIQMARQGQIEESKAFLRAHSKRRAA
ncbi:MAG: hypothetical protein PHN84_12825 [Desulfuromonadaceae bacterium]|nr:hypothetical protein [Desulfuromonadaceae bacterium]MDD2856474.1 hypothetical protein [Desulfuromonadaceae bacterium]